MSDHGERIAALEKGHGSDHEWISSLERRVRDLEAVINKQKGGWFVLVLICGGSGGIGALIVKLINA